MFDFISKRKWFFLLSTLVLIAGLIALIVSGLNLSLDFKPGTSMTLIFKNQVETETLRSAFSDMGYSSATIQHSSKDVFLFEDLPSNSTERLVDELVSDLSTTIRSAEFKSAGNRTIIALIIGKTISTEDLAKHLQDIPYEGNSTFEKFTFEKITLDSYIVRVGEQKQQGITEKVSYSPLRQLQSANVTATETPDQLAANETIEEDQEQKPGNETSDEVLDEQNGADNGTVIPSDQQQDTGESDVVPVSQQRIRAELESKFGPLDYLDYNSISAAVSSDRVKNTIYAVLLGSVGILLYVAWAFRKLPKSFLFGTCALIALLHDVLIVLAVFAVFHLEVGAMFIIAELTIIGYSINNMIVVFDRIRENKLKHPTIPFDIIVNRSLNQTLARSMNTSLTTLFGLFALLFFGGQTLQSFVIALIVGIVGGLYSSLLISSQLIISWEHGEIKRIFSWIPIPRRGRES